jgi:hypothetical protein
MSAQDLSLLATLKSWLPINSGTTTDDFTLSRLLTAVSQDFQRAVNRPDILQATYTEAHQADGSSRMIVFHWPIVAITSLTINGVTIPPSTDKIAVGYYIDQDIDSERIWHVYLNGYVFTDGAPVVITYEAGYVQPGAMGPLTPGQIALPSDVEQGVLDWCAHRYKNRPNVAAGSRRSTEGESIQPEQLDAPPNVLQVIERYKRSLPSHDRRNDEWGGGRGAHAAVAQQAKQNKRK